MNKKYWVCSVCLFAVLLGSSLSVDIGTYQNESYVGIHTRWNRGFECNICWKDDRVNMFLYPNRSKSDKTVLTLKR